MNEAYSALSKVYEYLICDCDYRKWSQYLLKRLREFSEYGSVVDCACGSGYFTRAIKRAGYSVTGVDLSCEMLAEAGRLSSAEGLKIPYIQGDMANLKVFEKVDFITVVNDGINYVSPEKIPKVFNSFRKALKNGGRLLFDFSSEYKIKNVIGNNLFGEDDENCSYLWFNRQGDGYVDMDIVLFLRNGEYFVKKEESHRQFAHTSDFIRVQLENAGFIVEEISGHLGEKVADNTERLNFIAKKA